MACIAISWTGVALGAWSLLGGRFAGPVFDSQRGRHFKYLHANQTRGLAKRIRVTVDLLLHICDYGD